MIAAEFILKAVKAAVPLMDYLRSRGIEPNRAHKIPCPWHDERTPSCHVYADSVHCFGCGKRGDVSDAAAALERFATPRDAARELARRYGIVCAEEMGTERKPMAAQAKPERGRAAVEPLVTLPPEAMATWSEGVDYISAMPVRAVKLAECRGWPVEWAQYLVDCAAVSMPVYHGERTIAFLVEGPEHGSDGTMRMRDVGYHCRLKALEGEKPSWRFVPNEREHGQRTPSLPFIVSGSGFREARRLFIFGGQWDALTFAFAAGWRGTAAGGPWTL